MNPEGLIIDGSRSAASDGGVIDVQDPSTGELLTRVAKGTTKDIDRAVKAARAAMDSKAWGGMAPAERGRILNRMAQKIRDRAEELAELESRDNGKPLKQSRTDVQVSARYFEFFAGIADKIMGNTIPLGPGFLDFTLREPIGVSAQIIPWNYPIQIGSRSVAPALAAGCTVVMKPAEDAPMTALRLGEIGLDCGLPPGVLNIVPGLGPDAGAALASHPDINQLTFTGSVEVGIAVAKMAADNVVPVVMELGGKSPNIVFADADLDLATQGVSTAIFQNAGQTCSAGSRLLVERKAHDALLEKLTARAKTMTIGPGISDPDMGPIISKKQLATIERYVKVGQDEGATVAVGGKRPAKSGLPAGNYFEPTLLTGVTRNMRVAQEEIFGPVLAIIPFDDIDEAASIANDSVYGLVAGVWTRDINKALSLATRIKSGQVYVNTYGAGGGVELPFGGYKKSGYGREKSLESLASYTQIKNVCIKFA
ncbi:MAG TPA: aldehyde dehydrogenase family protein [Gemmatimonadaceae bacterium]|nr:aldehyde dehydrogenase family protein [Gemmatimonadaceae bacterium]